MNSPEPDESTRRPLIRPWRWWRRFTAGARTRILISIVLLLAFSTILSTFALRQILLARVDTRIEAGLAQEVAEFRSFAGSAKEPKTGNRVKDIQRIFDLFLARDIPDHGEATFTFVAGQPYRSNADMNTSKELLTHVRELGQVDRVARGDVAIPGGHIRYLAVPVTAGESSRGTFVVTSNLGHERSEVNEAVRVAAGIGLAMLLLVSVLAYLATGRVLAPLRELENTAHAISSGDDLTRRIEVHGRDEIADLGRTFNAMLDRLEEAFRLQRDFVSDAGHELRTPITIIRGHLELLDDDPAEREQTMAIVTDELDRMSRFVEDLLTLARAERPDFLHLGEIDLDLLTEELIAKATQLADRDWQLEQTGVGLVTADRQRLTQAVMNLAHNAVQHTVKGDRIALGSALSDGSARLWITDSGPGIAAEDAARVFERFARVGNAARRSDGAGLGLAIVRTIAEAHGGRVELESEPGDGARFTIVIPADAPDRVSPNDGERAVAASAQADPERMSP